MEQAAQIIFQLRLKNLSSVSIFLYIIDRQLYCPLDLLVKVLSHKNYLMHENTPKISQTSSNRLISSASFQPQVKTEINISLFSVNA